MRVMDTAVIGLWRLTPSSGIAVGTRKMFSCLMTAVIPTLVLIQQKKPRFITMNIHENFLRQLVISV